MSDIHSNANQLDVATSLTETRPTVQEPTLEEQLAQLKAEKAELEELYTSALLNKKTPAPDPSVTAVGLSLGSMIGTGISSVFGVNRALTLGVGSVLGVLIGAIVSMKEE